jgi:hypothetical protein
MAAYVASQLFLAVHKVTLPGAESGPLLSQPNPQCPTEVIPTLPPAEHFPTVLDRYFMTRQVTKDNLLLLVTKSDAMNGIDTNAALNGCG